MRLAGFILGVLVVMALGFWAYRENYRTLAQVDRMKAVQREIATLHDRLGVLKAEWAWLNRPERLQELVELNHEKLRLVPLRGEQFAPVKAIPYAPDPTPEPAAEPTPTETSP